MDLTDEWQHIVQSALASADLSEELKQQLRSSIILKPKQSKSQFLQVADSVEKGIQNLEQFISGVKRDYTSTGKFDNKEKDKIEEEVGSVVRTCTKQIEQLKDSVVSAQRTYQDGEPFINEQTAAHLHGVVLVLVEQLHGVSAMFDKCRAVRYQQGLAKELQLHRKVVVNNKVAPRDSSWQEDDMGERAHGFEQQRQQTFENPEVQQLMNELPTTSQQAFQVERTMREITTLNQMISTAVMQQAESIEQLYNTAVEATINIQRGNKSLKKALALNRSSTRVYFVLLMTASFLLLFFHWFYS